MRNIYTEDLRTLTVEDIYDFCDALREENQRLEIKRELKPRDLAKYACAFANADGGILVIGVEDPDKATPLQFSPSAPDVSTKAIARFTNAVNALVSPALDIDVVGIGPDSSGNALVVARVQGSFRGPHEYLGSERPRLPVRRGHEISELALADIAALQARRQGGGGTLGRQNKFPQVNIEPTPVQPEVFFGMRIVPATYRTLERVLDTDDDRFFVDLELSTRGLESHVHLPLNICKTLPDGFYLADKEEPPGARMENTSLHKMHFDSDGDITIRFGQRLNVKLLDQYHGILIAAYFIAQKTFRHLGLTSQAKIEFRANLGSNATEEGVAPQYHGYFDVDLARDRFADAVSSLMMRMRRSVNKPTKRDLVRDDLQRYADLYVPDVDSLPGEWIAMP
jgi:hypothetical protein